MVIVNDLYPQVIKRCRPLIIEDDVLKVLVKRFSESISKSLHAEYASTTPVKCKLTHVNDFPTGAEEGSFIGLDFSGKIFRLVLVTLEGNRLYNTMSKLYEFPEQRTNGNSMKIVEYVAKCVNNFIETFNIMDEKTILGVASSFPVEQESLQDAKVLEWNSEFKVTEQNQDFFALLKAALKKYKFTKKIYLISLVSNSTASLLSAFYKDPMIRVGFYLGDNLNLTYVEKYKNITKYEGDGIRTRALIGLDMKNFGDDGGLDFIRTDADYEIDSASSNPGKNILEKLVSGAYLGEIARNFLYDLASSGVILKGYTSPELSTKNTLKTTDLAVMEMDKEKTFDLCRAVMASLGYRNVSDSDCIQIRFVCRCVSRRSSNLIAACLAALMPRMENREVRMVGNGALLKEFPNYEVYLKKKLNQLKKPDIKYYISKADKEDIAAGAGIVAHIYKDPFIKLEDKHRALPPFNPNKYNLLKTVPASLMNCECEPGRTT